jgi:hypothetical protein
MAQGKSAQLDGGRELVTLTQQNPYLGSILKRMIDAVNNVATASAVSAVGKVPPPAPVDSVQVNGTQVDDVITSPSETLHWTLEHNAAIQKGINYISEVDTSPNFTNPHVIDHGASRSAFLNLPARNEDDTADQIYYLRSYAQYPGSDASAHTVVGGANAPLKIKLTGTSKGTLLQSKGSGTAPSDGSRGGQGLGTDTTRPEVQPKRSVSLFFNKGKNGLSGL